jgi:hypothetical protein
MYRTGRKSAKGGLLAKNDGQIFRELKSITNNQLPCAENKPLPYASLRLELVGGKGLLWHHLSDVA